MAINPSKRLAQLKFITTIFSMSLKEIKDIMGFETLTMIFRRVGEAAGENIVKRFQGKYTSIEEFANLLISEVIEPVLGEGNGTASVSGSLVSIDLAACPYKVAGIPIKDMSWFCEYTEGLFDSAIRGAFPGYKVETKSPEKIAQDCPTCKFEITYE
ncbi:MAG TPA: hypothetical protein VKK79_23135 [Candidatus Lokiarchaeia archaeon]|nr:hypothetical protein [Candidatus Lokiarchaeia archaeon]